MSLWKKTVNRYFLEKEDKLLFERYSGEAVDYEKVDNLYLHIPFCRNKCPYCPYFKEKYEAKKAEAIGESLLNEIKLHADNLAGKKIASLYIGGGTPTLMNDYLLNSIEHLRAECSIDKIALETNPEEITEKLLDELEEMGCGLISLGIQDFNQKYLNMIGRKYTVAQALKGIELTKRRNFETINIDLIFAYPGQTKEELDATLMKAINSGTNQITLYPLFTFPYSSIGKYNKTNKVILPSSDVRKRFYYHICETLFRNGFQQQSVWSFSNKTGEKYSSVTRDYFLGLGPSAATYTGKEFLFNTFSLDEYSEKTDRGETPFALKMNVSDNLEKLFWLYWRLYETKIPLNEYRKRFGSEFRKDYKLFTLAMKHMRFSRVEEETLKLNRRGIHYIHLLQNHFALNYVNQIWSRNIDGELPEEIRLLG